MQRCTMRGKLVIVISRSFSVKDASINCRRNRMLRSTARKSDENPPYGLFGVATKITQQTTYS
jgi:hypothetical protein